MAERLLLTREENLKAIGLSLIGIGLPQEYALRVHYLEQLAKEKGLGNITVEDAVNIEYRASEEIRRREQNAEKEG